MKTFSDLRPYQRDALDFVMHTPRAYLAAKAGAGKTAVGLAYAAHLILDAFEVQQVLVVCPKRVVAQWPQESTRWAFSAGLTFRLYVGDPKARKAVLGVFSHVMVVSFEFFPELVRHYGAKDWPFGLVIFDEASRLRSGGRRGSVGWKAMQAISVKTDARILLMSGSPRPGTAHELFAPVALLDKGERLGRTLTGFRAEYLEPNKSNRHTGQVYSWRLREGKEAELYDRIADLYFAVAPDLGLASVTIDREVELPAAVEEMAQALRRDMVLDLDALELTAASQGTVEGKLHQLCQGAVFDDTGGAVVVHDEKLDELEQILDEIDAPAIVAYWYTHDKERLMRRFPDAVDITTEAGLAAAKAGRVRVALLHPASAGHGIDGLQQVYSTIVWFTIPASYELYDQACKRIIRSGQTETVRVYRIIAANGLVDPKAVERLAQKESEQDRFYQHLEGRKWA